MNNFLKFIEEQIINENTTIKKYIDTQANKIVYIIFNNDLPIGISSIDNR